MAVPRFATSVQLDGVTCITSVPKGSRADRLATSVFCPLGMAPTRAWVLMEGQDARALAAGLHSLTWNQLGEDGVASRTLTFNGLYLIKAERLLHGGPGDNSALYLVELGDARWKLSQRLTDTGGIRANIRSYANSADYLTSTSGYTWASLLTALWNACGLLGAYPGLPAGLPIDAQPENTFLIGLDAWQSLCAVLEQLDCAVNHDPLTGLYTIVQLGGAQTIPAEADTLLWDGEPVSHDGDAAAATLRIYYTYHRKSYGQERDTELATNWAYNGAGDVKEIATGITGATGTKPLWDDLPWILDEDGAHSNLAAVETRRDNRKSRYVTRQSVDLEHRIHAGLLSSIETGGKCRAVLWRNWDDGKSKIGGTVTEFVCKPEIVTSLKQTESGTAWFESAVTPEQENYLAPDLGRHSYPNYPRIANIIQAYSSGGSSGDILTANSDGLHPGRIARYVAGSLAIVGPGTQDCWIKFVDAFDKPAAGPPAINLDYYGPGRLSGVETSDGSLFPVYTVRRGAIACKVGVLDGTLSQGGSATVNEAYYSGSTQTYTGTAFTAWDWFEQVGGAITAGTKVACAWIYDRWVVIQVGCDVTDTEPSE